MKIEAMDEGAMRRHGEAIGSVLKGGEVIELIGDVGAGKTTFTKGIGRGLGIDESIQSPSFTISRVYDARDNLRLAHYDFYRLQDAGVMSHELEEASADSSTVTIIEWSGIVEGILPSERLQIRITPTSETGRILDITPTGVQYEELVEAVL